MTGFLQIEGAENVLIEGCLFERIDGNGVMISGYNRNTSIIDNEFHLVGENGAPAIITAWLALSNAIRNTLSKHCGPNPLAVF